METTFSWHVWSWTYILHQQYTQWIVHVLWQKRITWSQPMFLKTLQIIQMCHNYIKTTTSIQQIFVLFIVVHLFSWNQTTFITTGKNNVTWLLITVMPEILHKIHCKVSPDHAMEAYRGNKGIAPFILNPGTRWRWVVKSSSGRFTAWQETQYPLNWRLEGSQSWSGHFRKREKFIFSCGIWTLVGPVHSLAAWPKT